MFELATAAQMKRMDQRAIQDRGIPSTVLMERAAQGILLAIEDLMEDAVPGKGEAPVSPHGTGRGAHRRGGIPLYPEWAGTGQDRRRLFRAGQQRRGRRGRAPGCCRRRAGQCAAILVGKREKMTADCREMERRLNEAGRAAWRTYVPGDGGDRRPGLPGADVLVDALFGVGLNAPLQGEALAACWS